jgi:hypothetical protein
VRSGHVAITLPSRREARGGRAESVPTITVGEG